MYDIEGFISRQFEDYRYYGNPTTDISICCPFCEKNGAGEDTKYHLNVRIDADKQVVHCFRCGYSASWVQFVIDVTGLSYIQARAELYVTPRIREDMRKYTQEQLYPTDIKLISKLYDLPADFSLLSDYKHKRLDVYARHYLYKRNFDEAVWKRYNIGVSESIGYRVIIPVENGYWQGRRIYDWLEPKYLNPKEPARNLIFNPVALEIYDEVVICEGAFSAIAVGENAVALIGKEPTMEKTERLSAANVSTYVIALEAGAFNSMGKLADNLSKRGKNVIIWEYAGADDPASSSKHSTRYYDFKTKISLLLK